MRKRDNGKSKKFVMFARATDKHGAHRKASVQVSEEVYREWYKATNHFAYLRKLDRKHGVLSLDALDYEFICYSIFEVGIDDDDEAEFERRIANLVVALSQLNEKDAALIDALFFEGVSMREYGRRIGVTHRTVSKHRARVLKHLRRVIENRAARMGE
ncbi:hypothetical protein KQI08_11430 [Paraeggerthella hongkongensis]|uniref:sigma factor-like helix-turn-helix DNA-binding protein n=1 Tax=Eggerthellaceae TaxID=1643826 RepID=UPI001C120584|nr:MULTISPECIES: sigma factor-like helix-turn-helix DNA-binding protein [Paraeggerthella]MBU5406510.1 hypothetical protein [Paraeggerthella hongkongensis]MCD2434276.1 hypothetical protein [Paraeggerthella hominis]